MPRVKIGPALPDRKTLDGEIARLRDLDVGGLRSHWHNVFGRRPHPHLPRNLLFRVLAYRLQADVLGDLDGESQRLLDRSVSPEDAGQRVATIPGIGPLGASAITATVTDPSASGRGAILPPGSGWSRGKIQ